MQFSFVQSIFSLTIISSFVIFLASCSQKETLDSVDFEDTIELREMKPLQGAKINICVGSIIPDHISIEIEFMQKLINREREAREHNDKKTLSRCLEFEKKFIDEHLSQWIPSFCDKVIKESNDSFYGQMAKLTKKFILTSSINITGNANTML